MDPIDILLAAVPGGGRRVGGQWLARCPAHEDRRPSLALRERDDGAVLLKCHAGCETSAVIDALDLCWSDLYPEDSGW